MEIIRVEAATLTQSPNIRDEELAVGHFDQAFLAHSLKHAVDMHSSQPASIGEIFLSKR